MKRMIAVLLAGMLCACSGSSSVLEEPKPSDTGETGTAAPVTSETPAETETETKAEPEVLTDIIAFLEGAWNIRTNDSGTDSDSVLEFDPAGKTVYAFDGDNRYIRAGTKLFSSDESSGITDDAIRFTAYEAADDLIAQYGDNMMIYSSDMQYLAGIYEGEDYLFLRELGNGLSVLDSSVLKEENVTGEYGWVFTRDNNAPLPDDEESRMRDGDYYAFCWKKDGEAMLLQKVDVVKQTVDWYGEEIDTLRIRPVFDYSSMQIHLYNSDVIPERFAPGLYRVTVDTSGTVTDLESFAYIGYGAYRIIQDS